MLKVGDKLLCKKSDSLRCKRGKSDKVYLGKVKDKYYIITDIVNNRIYFDDDYYYLNSLSTNWFKYIWDYFYTPQELRKMKLEKLRHVKNR